MLQTVPSDAATPACVSPLTRPNARTRGTCGIPMRFDPRDAHDAGRQTFFGRLAKGLAQATVISLKPSHSRDPDGMVRVRRMFGAGMIACDRDILTASALADGRRILPGRTLLLGLTLALRRP